MSSTPSRTVATGSQRDRDEQIAEGELGALLGALEDDDCRSILEATSEQALSTGELCEQCGLSTSSAYRKVDTLTEVGLLEKSVRVRPTGSHTSEYRLAVDRLEMSLGSEGLDVSVSQREAAPPALSAD